MILTCGVRGEAEAKDHPIFVCHHCGMPVCASHGWVVPSDDAFHDSRDTRVNRDTASKPGSRAAMHCPRCADKYHPRASDKHHEWDVTPARAALWRLRTVAPIRFGKSPSDD
jgi:hypothetical protein